MFLSNYSEEAIRDVAAVLRRVANGDPPDLGSTNSSNMAVPRKVAFATQADMLRDIAETLEALAHMVPDNI